MTSDLARFYQLLARQSTQLGGPRRLADCGGLRLAGARGEFVSAELAADGSDGEERRTS